MTTNSYSVLYCLQQWLVVFFYFSILFSLFTLVDYVIVFDILLLIWSLYSSIVVTCRLILMRVKVCYACVNVTGTFRHQNRPQHAIFLIKDWKNFLGRGHSPPPHAPPPSAPLAPRSSRLQRASSVPLAPRGPPNEMSGSATAEHRSIILYFSKKIRGC